MQKIKIISSLLVALGICFKPAISSEAQINVGEVAEHKRSDTLAYTYYHYVPHSASKTRTNYIYVECISNGGSDDYSHFEIGQDGAQHRVSVLKDWAEDTGFIILSMATPRGYTQWMLYGHALTRAVLTTDDEFYKRPDLKLIDVLNDFTALAANEGYDVNYKIFIGGFSAGSAFAQRFGLLHPDRVIALAAGGCGAPTMPLEYYDNTLLTYPVGVGDLEELEASKFDLETYKNIAQFTYLGAEDTKPENDPVGHLDCFTDEQSEFINNHFGENPQDRAEFYHNVLLSLGIDSTLKIYEGVEHGYGPGWDDHYNFIASFKDTGTEDDATVTTTSNGGGCFIVTVAYGSPISQELATLKTFRDNDLLKTSAGRSFVKFYYKVSPLLANYIGEREILRAATKFALTSLVYGVKYPKTSVLIFLSSVIAMTLTLRVKRLTRSQPIPKENEGNNEKKDK